MMGRKESARDQHKGEEEKRCRERVYREERGSKEEEGPSKKGLSCGKEATITRNKKPGSTKKKKGGRKKRTGEGGGLRTRGR